jgi:hypothetical protein
VHARRVVPDEEGLAGLLGIVAVKEVDDLGGDRQVHLPLQLQVLLGGRFEGAGGQAPAIVSDPIDLDGSCHGFPALVLAF